MTKLHTDTIRSLKAYFAIFHGESIQVSFSSRSLQSVLGWLIVMIIRTGSMRSRNLDIGGQHGEMVILYPMLSQTSGTGFAGMATL